MYKSLITRKRLDGFVWLAHKSKFDDESIGAGPEIRKLAVQQNISGTQKVGVARNFFVLISPFFLILDPNMVLIPIHQSLHVTQNFSLNNPF